MNRAAAFLKQARSDFSAYELLQERGAEMCHAMHYLQMATEKLSRAAGMRIREPWSETNSHAALVKALQLLKAQPRAVEVFANGSYDTMRATVNQALPAAYAIQSLAPQIAGDSANPEYPWENKADPGHWIPPCDYSFISVTQMPYFAQLVRLMQSMLDHFDEVFDT